MLITRKDVKMRYEIWTDGSTKGNGKQGSVGAFAYIIKRGSELVEKCASGAIQNTTNQRMELDAAIHALQSLDEWLLNEDKTLCDVYIFSDSAYLVNCCNQNWYRAWENNGWVNSKKQPVANQDLWEMLIPYFKLSNYHFVKVKGHADNQLNNLVDELAQSAAGGK